MPRDQNPAAYIFDNPGVSTEGGASQGDDVHRGMTAESGVRGKGARARGVMRPLLGDESLARSPRPAAGRPTRRRAKGKWRRCPGGDESSTALTADASVGVARPSCPTALHREGAPSAALTAISSEARREQEGQCPNGS